MTAKEKIFQSIEEKKEQYIQAADHIWEYAETSFREYRSSRELAEILEKEGFTVDKGIAGGGKRGCDTWRKRTWVRT